MAKANVKDAPAPKAPAVEALIVKGKEQGFLSQDDIFAGFPDVELNPDQLSRIFDVFRDMGIKVGDGEKDSEEVLEIDDDLIAAIQAMGSVSRDAPVRMYLKGIGRVALLRADQDLGDMRHG